MKKAGKLVTGLLGLAMAAVTILPCAASTVYTHDIEIPAHMVWTKIYGAERSQKNKEVKARCNSVEPPKANWDTFTKIRCRVVNGMKEPITEKKEYVLEEGKGYVSMELLNGYLDVYSVSFQFRGNSESAAIANVSYWGW
ncbi:hypothetical protein [Pseudoflavonifractor sp. An187]|uniref:hypothetical protein n=1 Tax=Pseudoflavonifractor sp. An187 TaxID=1965578 RepID=UPI000B39D81E|nr:hypothetical protein [Pseudoflavonifractor sp. An187]OUP46034.1 hypothetical protein B5F22_01990 [Pseudoflavonifractor sp. An187]